MPTVCDKIDAFEQHILTRQLRIGQLLGMHFTANQPCDELSESAFVILSIGLAYFEMIEQFASRQPSNRQSPAFFERGFRRVYGTPSVNPSDVSNIYSVVRCGMYHTAMPKARCGLSRELPRAFANENGVIVINPARLIDDLIAHFASFCQDLRKPPNAETAQMRSNFEKIFDSFRDSAQSARAITKTSPAPWDL